MVLQHLMTGLPEDLVTFVRELRAVRDRYRHVSITPVDIPCASIRLAVVTGQPLLELVAFTIAENQFYDLLDEVLSTVRVQRPSLKEQIDRIKIHLKQVDLAVLAFKGAIDENVYFRSLAQDAAVSQELYHFLVNQAVRPFLIAFAREYASRLDLTHWRRPYCPICGRLSDLSRLSGDEEGRHLVCIHCQSMWEYERSACPHCGNKEPDNLDYLMTDEYPGWQIHICQRCQGYVKTVDSRQAFVNLAVLDEFDTLMLDIIAQKKGYLNERIGPILN
ncbi:formate dehydrogenase accessory protein FdhE [Heliobacterium chlorum]|uniref:Formate dehydrogenase accessory protein FdhE n=1 Tax=Heliobacterium chlorum TaxID=2698 RepID=A0ABR7SX80_HELCL|nr:formate dehydrogenase accessory protein FdhE [Heliobacterium chlorum]